MISRNLATTFGPCLVAACTLAIGCGVPAVNTGNAEPAVPGGVDADAPEEFTETESGLKYRIRRRGTGGKPTIDDAVTVHYKGWLDDGKQFDSSYDRGAPTSFPLGGVVQGWQEGLQLVSEGGMIELEIPSELGYGAKGAGSDIPPHATLHFLVELISIQ